MNNAEFDDLKQFMTSLISQSEASLEAKFEAIMDKKLNKLEKKMDDGFAGVGEAIESLGDLFESRHKNHEKRIVKLEHKVA